MVSWLTRFSEAAAEIWMSTDGKLVHEITIPGLDTDNNKGNVILKIPDDEREAFITELLVQTNSTRPQTAAEAVRRTAEWENLGSEDAPDFVFTFKASSAAGSRTVKVRQADVDVFLEALSSRFVLLRSRWDEVMSETTGG